jgi:hypothetical protein
MIRRILQIVKAQKTKEQLLDKVHEHQHKIKQAFDRKARKEDFQLGDLVLRWDAPREDRGKHNKFEALWIGPFKSFELGQNNTYRLHTWEGDEVFGGPVNGNFLNKFFI